ncbi:MAG: gamma-glutamyltranspeptidase, partial [Deltaproteobacteria bacterium]
PAVRAALVKKGHRVADGDGGFGGYQAIRYDAERGVFIGASEMRKDGQVSGY